MYLCVCVCLCTHIGLLMQLHVVYSKIWLYIERDVIEYLFLICQLWHHDVTLIESMMFGPSSEPSERDMC